MIVATHKNLYELLNGVLLYAEELDEEFFTADTAPRVTRWGSSEYRGLLDEQIPHIAIQPIRMMSENIDRAIAWQRLSTLWRYTDENDMTLGVHENQQPEPRIIEWQLDVRSPYDIWLTMIEQELDKLFNPIKDVTLTAQPLGATIGDIEFVVRYFGGDLIRVRSAADEVGTRMLRSTMRLTAHTWLLPSSSDTVQWDTVQQVRVTYLDGNDNEVGEYLTTEETP